MKYSACLFSTSGGVISSVTELCCHDKEGGCNESTRFTDGSGAVSPQCRGLRTNLRPVRQGQSSASAAGCHERLVRAIGGTGHCAGPFLFGQDLQTKRPPTRAALKLVLGRIHP